MNKSPVISALYFYPIKGCGAVPLRRAQAGKRGLESGKIGDRRWMIVDAKGKFVSQREKTELARIKIGLVSDTLNRFAEKIRVSVDGMKPMILDSTQIGNEVGKVFIHGKETVGHFVPGTASRWFSEFLGEEMRLVYQADDDLRYCDPAFAAHPDSDIVGFADAYPFLVTNLGTLASLNHRLENPVPMNRFRPNIVIGDAEPEAEYGWKTIGLGEHAIMSLVKPCTRCVVTTVDQETGIKTGAEPLGTLARTYFLSQDFGKGRVQGAVFGENGIPSLCGPVRIGDAVKIIETKPMHNFRRREEAPRPN
jgi:uncharacterized protein YcbX